MPKPTKKDAEELTHMNNVMAIREELMEYFKGSCVQRLIDESDITIVAHNYDTQFRFQRRERDNKRATTLFVKRTPIMTLSKAPELIVLYEKQLESTKVLKAIHAALIDFLERYLSGIPVEYSEAASNEVKNMQRWKASMMFYTTTSSYGATIEPDSGEVVQIQNINMIDPIDVDDDMPF